MTRKPYPLSRRRQPELRDSVVLVADILGFSNLIKESPAVNDLNSTLNLLWQALVPRLRRFSKWAKEVEQKPAALKVFTDNIVIGWPFSGDGEMEYGNTLMEAACYQFELILDGLFVRGAMDIGPVYIDDYLAFGLPIITCHELEQKANYPRIILSDNVQSRVREHFKYYADPRQSPQNCYLLRDSEGKVFIDYLNVVITEADSPDVDLIKILALHKQSVEEKLTTFKTSKIRQKYEWTAEYHNFIVREYLVTDSELLIPVSSSFATLSRLA